MIYVFPHKEMIFFRMGRTKKRKSSPLRIRDPSPGLRLLSQISHRDILWKIGDIVSVIEDDEKYFAQVKTPCSKFFTWFLLYSSTFF